ncbi:lipid II flippase MurJ [Acidovorax lacteus]|uniref:Virulence factor MviN n=1 Tax=Acidovorax lacteus TaxID=1924988 RepID=A0ABP8LFD8_9BURK
MFLKAGLLSLGLLLASRVLGLARESAQAAAFGTTGMADVAVLMLTLPDWIAGLALSGAMAYVLVPAWAGRPAEAVRRHQRELARRLLIGGLVAAVALGWWREPLRVVLAEGLSTSWHQAASQALLWSAAALPLALLASLWATRLQHERDFVGLYGANLVVNAVLIGGIATAAYSADAAWALCMLGGGLVTAMLARLWWQSVRIDKAVAAVSTADVVAPLPTAHELRPGLSDWLWAMAAAGLPLALPVVARSVASAQGEGALAAFSYAWKLVELPLVLAIQLVAAMAFPHVAAAVKNDVTSVRTAETVRSALALAWTLACAAATALLVASPAIAQLLFGWGRMDAAGLERIAAWSAAAAWSLLPQALTAVALTVLATQNRLKPVVLAYTAGLLAVLLLPRLGLDDGQQLMWSLNAVYGLVGLVAWWQLGRPGLAWLPVKEMATPMLVMLLAWASRQVWQPAAGAPLSLALLVGCAAALVVAGAGWLASATLRKAVRA